MYHSYRVGASRQSARPAPKLSILLVYYGEAGPIVELSFAVCFSRTENPGPWTHPPRQTPPGLGRVALRVFHDDKMSSSRSSKTMQVRTVVLEPATMRVAKGLEQAVGRTPPAEEGESAREPLAVVA